MKDDSNLNWFFRKKKKTMSKPVDMHRVQKGCNRQKNNLQLHIWSSHFISAMPIRENNITLQQWIQKLNVFSSVEKHISSFENLLKIFACTVMCSNGNKRVHWTTV